MARPIPSILALTLLLSLLPHPTMADSDTLRSDDEIESLLAPIALYPDTLLTQIFVAATYPLEVVEAARWLDDNRELSGSDAVRAAAAFDWDPSVQTLTAFPEVLQRMNDDLRWTRDLGDTFLNQREDLMLAVQTLRQRARLAGTLDYPEHLRLRQEGERLSLESAASDQIHVPWYDSTIAYGEWPSTRHQPVYWEPIAWHHSGRQLRSSFLWAPPIHLDARYYPTRLDWHPRGVVVIDRRQQRPWQHDAQRRQQARGDSGRDVAARRSEGRPPAQQSWPSRQQRRGRDDSSRERVWPEQPTASLSQQRATAIDTRTASERLRALQEEAAREQRQQHESRHRGQPRERVTRQMTGPTRQAPMRADTETQTRERRQRAGRTANTPTESRQPSRPSRSASQDRTTRTFGRGSQESRPAGRPAEQRQGQPSRRSPFGGPQQQPD